MSQPPTQLAVDEQLRDRRPVGDRRELLADARVGQDVDRRERRRRATAAIATVRAEKPQAGASGVPFMNRITLCSAIASAIASRIGLRLAGAAASGAGAAAGRGDIIGIGSNWLLGHGRGCLVAQVGARWLLRALRLQRQGVDRRRRSPRRRRRRPGGAARCGCRPCEGLGGDRRAEVVAAAGVVLDLGARARDGRLDALLDVLAEGIVLKRRGSRRLLPEARSAGAILWKVLEPSTGAKR